VGGEAGLGTLAKVHVLGETAQRDSLDGEARRKLANDLEAAAVGKANV
jgi:hypothetical protein